MAQVLPSVLDCCSPKCACQPTGYANPGMLVVSTLDELRTHPSLPSNLLAWVGSGNTFWGAYRWNNTDASTDDGINVIMPTDGGPGRWNKQI